MATVSSLKTEGNAAFAGKDWKKAVDLYSQALKLDKEEGEASAALLSNRSAAYLHLGDFDKALADANLAVLRRPKWSKAYARVAEVYARQQNFKQAEHCYKQAINHAEDATSKTRYQASLETTMTASTKAMRESADTKLRGGDWSDHFSSKLERFCAEEGYVVRRDGGLAVTLAAWSDCKSGMEALDKAMVRFNPQGNIEGNVFSIAIPNICECILTDDLAFCITAGKDPKWPLPDKFNKIVKFEIMAGGGAKYFTNAVWSPAAIIEDLDKRIATDGRTRVRQLSASLIRGQVVTAFALSGQGEQGGAVSQFKFALGMLEAGCKRWAHEKPEDRGMSFQPTFLRNVRVQLLKAMLRASRDAKTSSAKRVFNPETVEKLANEILEENRVENWPSFDGSTYRMAYYVLPNWEAYSALAFASGYRAREPLIDLPSGTARFAEIKHAKKAAEYYDKAAALMPDDWHAKRDILWYALEMHLRAGGLTISELFRRTAEVEKVAVLTDRIFGTPDAKFESQVFVMTQVNATKDTVAQMPRSANALSATIKPVPTVNLRGTPRGFDPRSIVKELLWGDMPGGVCIADILYPGP
ncbi:hypothetical protein JCM10207_000557 [Rhodosporidiobolus poonsookiae]